jgi:hypothetical protein
MKKILITLLLALSLVIEIFLISLLIYPACINRRSHTQAFAKWYENPSVENKQILEKENLKTKRIRITIDSIIAIVCVLNACGIIILFKKRIKWVRN